MYQMLKRFEKSVDFDIMNAKKHSALLCNKNMFIDVSTTR